jgi:threonine synthase
LYEKHFIIEWGTTQETTMKYSSTRNTALQVNSFQAILEGLAPDGGLYLPETLPHFDLNALKDLDFKALMTEILFAYFDEFGKNTLKTLVDQAYDGKFESETMTPLSRCGDLFILELYHGPTAAFKDIALSILPHLMVNAKEKLHLKETTHILTATSGDTGSAALAGFEAVKGFTITVFYPSKGISEIQKRQMTTSAGHNTFVYGIEGNFDDAQNAVKDIFTRAKEFNITLSSANSINIGRLVPQLCYYYKAYFELVNQRVIQLGDEVSFSVPSGNFGNILAAYLAKQGGLPIKHLICASNENEVLTDFIKTGTYDRRRPFYTTSSPSMDILVSSNLERLLALMSDRNSKLIVKLMEQLRSQGFYTLPQPLFDSIQALFIGVMISQQAVDKTILETYQKHHVLLDPHSAIGVNAALRHQGSEPMIVCATASAFKFPTTVLKALGQPLSGNDFDDLEHLISLSPQACPTRLTHLRHDLIHHPLTVKKEALFALVKAKEHYDSD